MIKIVTDSACKLPSELIKKLDITVVPLSFSVGDSFYTDDGSASLDQFLKMVEKSRDLPKTSQPPIGQFSRIYEDLTADGSQVLSIHLSNSLSGTVEGASQAARLIQGKVTVVDSESIDQALGFQVETAGRMAKEGKSLDDIIKKISKIRENTKVYVGISTLKNLVKGGRISRLTGAISTVIKMKVILEFKHGKLIPIIKGRGKKVFGKFYSILKDELETLRKSGKSVLKIGISYSGDNDFLNNLKAEVEKFISEYQIIYLQTTPVIATHTGENAFGFMYFTDWIVT